MPKFSVDLGAQTEKVFFFSFWWSLKWRPKTGYLLRETPILRGLMVNWAGQRLKNGRVPAKTRHTTTHTSPSPLTLNLSYLWYTWVVQAWSVHCPIKTLLKTKILAFVIMNICQENSGCAPELAHTFSYFFMLSLAFFLTCSSILSKNEPRVSANILFLYIKKVLVHTLH